ncbi:MAG TPA: radical SAM family heme chaperone HemW [Clostridiaceae bacterium]|nr:radical SAM family heme chaperone HemW [Clostridiaceae bacterium]
MEELGIYIHIPFCKQKCFYCDFCSFANKNEMQGKYVETVINEIKNITHKEKYTVTTIYLGGGTPSILNPDYIKSILQEIKSSFEILDDAEITIEINPGTVNEEKLKKYKEYGINRLSIGLQSANDKILKKIGRIHDYKQFEETFFYARKCGFKNINVDLMIGLPTQAVEDVKQTLEKIIQKNPEHISVYSLIIEEGTIIEKLINENKLQLPDEETERIMYWTVVNELKENGYNQYEISNFSKKTYESKHNTNCWKQKQYIGLGTSAHSYLNKKRYSNTNNIEEYIKNIQENNISKNITIHEEQTEESTMNEYMLLGLRMIQGININEFKQKFKIDPTIKYKETLEKLQKENLIQITKTSIKLTKQGIDFGNIVWEEFI